MRRQKIGQQTLEARLSELSAQVRQLQHIVQVVNGVAQRSNLSQLLFGRFQVLLHALELRESLLNILIQFLLYLAGDGEQLGIDPVANRIQTLRRFEVEIFKFGFELGGGQSQRVGQLRTRFPQVVGLLTPSAGQLSFHGVSDFFESFA